VTEPSLCERRGPAGRSKPNGACSCADAHKGQLTRGHCVVEQPIATCLSCLIALDCVSDQYYMLYGPLVL
jgi:hypothetical protein